VSLCHEQTLRTAPPTQSRTKPFQPSVGKCNVAANAAKKSMRTAYPCSAHLLVTRSTARMPGVLTSSHFLESWRALRAVSRLRQDAHGDTAHWSAARITKHHTPATEITTYALYSARSQWLAILIERSEIICFILIG